MTDQALDRADKGLLQRISEGRAGFTIVEVLVAMIILAVGVLGLAGTTMYVVRATKYGDITNERNAALSTIVEKLRAAPFDSVGNGSDSVGNFAVKWTSSSNSRSKLVTLITTGPGLRSTGAGVLISPSVADTFEYRVMR